MNRRTAALLITATLIAVLGGDTFAGKGNGNGNGKPGGGGDDPVPPGVIYFHGGSILADGTGEQSLPGVGADGPPPSYGLHGGHRWFLSYVFDGAVNPDGRNSSRILAVSEDGATEVDLTPASSAEWRVSGYDGFFAWAKDDSFFSFIAVEWFGTGALDAKSYIFKVGIDWTSGEPALVGAPTKIVEAGLEGSQAENGFAESQILKADWEPGGDRVVYSFQALQGGPAGELRVYTISSDTDVLLTDGGIDPQWAPDGGLIAYTSRRSGEWGIWTIDPDSANSDSALLLNGGKYTYDTPRWAPDSQHVCYRRSRRSTSGIAYVAIAGGKEKGVPAGGQPLGWRD